MTLDDRLNRVREALAEVWTSQGRRFATFEADGDEERWVQYVDGRLNLRWPLEEDPRTALPKHGVALPPGSFPGFWVPGETAIIEVGDVLVDDVAALVLALHDRLFGAGRRPALTVTVERIA